MVRPPLRTTTTFSAHSSTSGGRNMSLSLLSPEQLRNDLWADRRLLNRCILRSRRRVG
jgi:hypothetical protein